MYTEQYFLIHNCCAVSLLLEIIVQYRVHNAQRTVYYSVLRITTVYYGVLWCTTVYYGVQCNTMYSVHVFSCCWAVLKSERWPWPMSGCKTTSCFDFYQINVYLRLKTKINQKVNG